MHFVVIIENTCYESVVDEAFNLFKNNGDRIMNNISVIIIMPSLLLEICQEVCVPRVCLLT